MGQPVKLWSDKDYDKDDPTTYRIFCVFIQKKRIKAGGFNNSNSCFFDSLAKLIPTDQLPWTSDETFKKCLGLNLNDRVPITLMDKIQNYLPKFKIMITGDVIYTLSVKSHHEIKISLIDGHFSPVKLPKIVYGVATTEKIPLIYKRDHENTIYIVMSPKYDRRWKMS